MSDGDFENSPVADASGSEGKDFENSPVADASGSEGKTRPTDAGSVGLVASLLDPPYEIYPTDW